MDRKAWLQEIRRTTESRYDTLFAEDFDEKWGEISPTHSKFMNQFLETLPDDAHILDAACGTGKYWPMILEKGFALMGIDQSKEMISRAQGKFPSVSVKKTGLQEMTFEDSFHGVICVDAMEFVPPDEWPMVMENFHRALKSNGHLYFTVEIGDDEEICEAFKKGKEKNLPLVMGEDPHKGYHYFPEPKDIMRWIREADFTVILKDSGDYYHHFIVRKN